MALINLTEYTIECNGYLRTNIEGNLIIDKTTKNNSIYILTNRNKLPNLNKHAVNILNSNFKYKVKHPYLKIPIIPKKYKSYIQNNYDLIIKIKSQEDFNTLIDINLIECLLA